MQFQGTLPAIHGILPSRVIKAVPRGVETQYVHVRYALTSSIEGVYLQLAVQIKQHLFGALLRILDESPISKTKQIYRPLSRALAIARYAVLRTTLYGHITCRTHEYLTAFDIANP